MTQEKGKTKMTKQTDKQKTHGITKNRYTNEENKTKQDKKVCDLKAGYGQHASLFY